MTQAITRAVTCIMLLGIVPHASAQASAAAGLKAAERRAPDIKRLEDADKLIDDAIGRGELPGAVLLVGSDDEVVWRKAYGSRAVRPEREPMTTDTIFDLASLSKPIGCATSIMILAERGKIRLDAPVSAYIPAFASNGKALITARDLLLHRGGLTPDNSMEDYADGAETAFKKIFDEAPQWDPGSRFAYSDVGYIILGKLVETVCGKPLDRFAADEIFKPLGMADTAYNPPAGWQARCAPTQQRDGHWMRGEVHDPRSFALGGVAGHAGIFSTADDLARFCRMIIGEGRLDGRRILSRQTVREMTRPRCLADGTGLRSYGFDVATPYSSVRGDRFEPGTTFGHSGFTGTSLWIDPINDCYVILLSNAVHPAGNGNVIALRRRVATAVADALLDQAAPTTVPSTAPAPAEARHSVACGIDVLKEDRFKLLDHQRVALVTNQTGLDGAGHRTIDLLHDAKNLKLVKLFSPEHGLAGILDEHVSDATDPATGLKVFSLYGKTNKPTDEMLDGIDTVVFDIQDAGARYYTYISTMGLCMEAAAAHHLKMVVLDRPNPATGLIVDGPPAERSDLGFTAFAPIPVSHGMTVGELAKYFNDEMRIGCSLTVVPMRGWRRSMWWDETGLTWVNPSPNLRSPTADLLYSGIGLLENCNLSVGRGTDSPFEILGAPWVDGVKLADALNSADLAGLRFVPVSFGPTSSKFAGEACGGVRVIVTERHAVEPVRSGVEIAWHLHSLFGDVFDRDGVKTLLRNREAFERLRNAASPDQIWIKWDKALGDFRGKRKTFLLYAP